MPASASVSCRSLSQAVALHQKAPMMQLVPGDDPGDGPDADRLAVRYAPADQRLVVQPVEEAQRGVPYALVVLDQVVHGPLVELPGRNVDVLVESLDGRRVRA